MATITLRGDAVTRGALRRGPDDDAERAALVALSRVPGLGCASVRALVDYCGSATRALTVGSSIRLDVLTAGPSPGRRLTTAGRQALRNPDLGSARKLLAEVGAKGIAAVGYGMDAYASRLVDLFDPPPVVFIQGQGTFDAARTVAIVGTRAASSYGLRTAYALGRELGRWGWIVASGMARGVDAAAHEGALDAGGGSIGILGSGHDHEYPSENRELYARMREGGLLVSEFEPDTAPTRATFPRRNRLIAALGRAVIVIEAGAKSGALITADYALDLGREVLAVPGRIDDPAAVGCLRLLRQGAGLVTEVRDVFDALGWLHNDGLSGPAGAGRGPEGSRTQDGSGRGRPPGDVRADTALRLLRVLDERPLTPDDLALRLDASVTEVVRGLGRLELEGWVERRPGGRFAGVARPSEPPELA